MAFDSKGTVNKVILIGRLGQDPELKYTASGAAVLNLSIATNTSYKDRDGNYVDNTEWNRVVVWRKIAEAIANMAKKGSRVYVEGRLQTRSWDDQNGNKRYTTEVQADQIQMLESSGGSGGNYSSNNSNSVQDSQQAPPPEPDVPEAQEKMEDDLPF
ncbi:MAG: single-stranded DNA-binding protein [candidate division KSB1 bacterium]|nr:single-stranded DNA-binding protein [candidate division KSB1 bacterium]